MAYNSLQSIIDVCETNHLSFYEAILTDDIDERDITRKESLEQMSHMWIAMKEASQNYDANLKSVSGLSGGQAKKLLDHYESTETYCGTYVNEVMYEALKMAESNACMMRIVAAPTAGSCGVMPAVLIPYAKIHKMEDMKMIEALYVSAGIGQVIAERAYIAGAAGGCQAEIGAACAMAAGALVSLKGGSPQMIADAAAIALKCLLGLVCDPVAGLVEVPCVKRNVMGAVHAMTSADLVLAGIKSFVPADQVIDAMKEIGDKMHDSLKETGTGGLAATKIGHAFSDKFNLVN